MTGRNEGRLSAPVPFEEQDQADEVKEVSPKERHASLLDELQTLQTSGHVQSLEIPRQTHLVTLPSKGEFYDPGSPLHGREFVELKHPTLKEQMVLNSKSLVREGVAMERALQMLFTDPNMQVTQFLAGDKERLFIEMRRLMRGNEYHIEATCPRCGHLHRNLKYHLDQAKDYFPSDEKLEEIGVFKRTFGRGFTTFLFRLPYSKFIAEFRLLRGEDENRIISEQKRIMKEKEIGKRDKNIDYDMNIRIRQMLVSVNAVTDERLLDKFAMEMMTPDPEALLEAYEAVEPTTRMKFDLHCENEMCGAVTSDLTVPMNINFFWGRRRVS